MCKLSKLDLVVIRTTLDLILSVPNIPANTLPLLTEAKQLVVELSQKWDNQKGQRLWAISAHKLIVEDAEFVVKTNGAKCAISFLLDSAANMAASLVAAELNIAGAGTTAPTAVVAGPAATTGATIAVASASVPTTDVNQTRVFSW